jgi:hypothetical protein
MCEFTLHLYISEWKESVVDLSRGMTFAKPNVMASAAKPTAHVLD